MTYQYRILILHHNTVFVLHFRVGNEPLCANASFGIDGYCALRVGRDKFDSKFLAEVGKLDRASAKLARQAGLHG